MSLVAVVARMRSDSVLRALEVLLVINVPLVTLLVVKSFFSKEFNWWAVRDIWTHTNQLPSFSTVATATFIFTGYTSMAIFNKQIKIKGSWVKHALLISVMGLTTLSTTLLIPIGFHGTEAVAHYLFPWVITSDSMRLEFFVIERVLYLFLLLYLMIDLTNSTISWHAGLQMFTTALSGKWVSATCIVLFVALTYLLNLLIKDHYTMAQTSEKWLTLRFCSEFFYVAVTVFSVRRFKQRS